MIQPAIDPRFEPSTLDLFYSFIERHPFQAALITIILVWFVVVLTEIAASVYEESQARKCSDCGTDDDVCLRRVFPVRGEQFEMLCSRCWLKRFE